MLLFSPDSLEFVILSEAKDLLFAADSGSFASLRMTILGDPKIQV